MIPISSCCGACVTGRCPENDEATYYECNACHKPCQIREVEPPERQSDGGWKECKHKNMFHDAATIYPFCGDCGKRGEYGPLKKQINPKQCPDCLESLKNGHICGTLKNPEPEKDDMGLEDLFECRQPYSAGRCYGTTKLEQRLAKHYYTKHEVDDLLEKCLDQALAHFDTLRDQENQFRKAILDYLSLPNLGHKGEHLTWQDLKKQLSHIYQRFLP